MKKELTVLFNLDYHSKTILESLWSFMITLLPLLASLLLILFNKWSGWAIFWNNGEFFIYSTSFFATSVYLISNIDFKKNNFIKFILWLIIIGTMVSTSLYGSLFLAKITDSIKPDANILKNASLILLVLSVLILYVIIFCKNYQSIAIENSDHKDREDIEDIKNKLK